ncbi:gephyrin [Rhopalosiphum maidis]|uniref:gephyrin n=1 Tax=Rhopalosiphum maidis TaxID=43146 RepID=UPI000EFFC7AF|nr:gephyrin [Rhopalosiphum maidis]
MDFEKPTIKVGILTISDTRTPSASNIDSIDSSGQNLIKLINDSNVIESAKVVQYDCVTDDYDQIQAKMSEWCSERKVDVLLSTGGTGFSSRDVTPEATLGLVQKLTPGISQAIMNESLKLTPMAMLSRAVSGIYEKTLIINLPGSTKASKECLYVVARAIPHAVSLIKDDEEISKQFHKQLDFTAINESRVPECVTKIACRHRESQFPKISMKSALNILKEHAVLQYTENNKIKYPTVCIFSTGDELENISGYIRDTNSVMIKQILEQDHYKGQVFNFGIVRDNWDDLCKRFEEAFNNADIIVTSGGVSMGEKDLIKPVLKEHFKSKIHFGRVNMKPGMPTTFVTLFFKDKKKYIFCLPGNPVSAGVCTHLFLLPYLRSVSGKKIIIHSLKAKLTHSINDLDIRPEYRRALLKYENGELYVSCLTNYQQSSRLLSFVGSNCLLHLPSLSNEANIKSNTIMDVTLIKSIKNAYIAPILKEMNLFIEIFKKQTISGNIKKEQSLLFSCIKDVLHLMTENIFVAKTENIPTDSAMGYVLYLPVNSSENLPPFPASIKDGYAIKYINEDSWSQKSNIFNVVQVSVAGTVPACQKEIKEGECARISTGAPLPPGANCVVQVEDTAVISKSSDGKVELTIAILKEPKLFENIRSIGSDISVGQRLLDQKIVLGPFEIALLRSVGCDYVQVYKCPSIHIVPCNDNSAYAISHKLKNMLELADFKGNIFSHPLCKNLIKFSGLFESVFGYEDVIIICGSFYEFSNVVESHIHIRNDTRKISLGFGRMYYNEKKVVFLHIDTCDLDSIYNCVHLFILPFLRFTTGRKNIISSIKTKCNMTSHYLPSDKFEKAELYYENGDFNVTCYTMNRQSCLVNMPSSTNEFNTEVKEGKKTELDAIVTENSDSYFIYY